MNLKRIVFVLFLFVRVCFVGGSIENECPKARSKATESCMQYYRKELESLGCTNANDFATYQQICSLNWPESSSQFNSAGDSAIKINEFLLWPIKNRNLIINFHIDWSNLPNYSQEKAGLMFREMNKALTAWGSVIGVRFTEIQDVNAADLVISFSGQTYPSGTTSSLIEGHLRKFDFKPQVDSANGNKCYTNDPIHEPILKKSVEFVIHDYEDYKFDIDEYKSIVNDVITLITQYGKPDAWQSFTEMVDSHKFGYSFYTVFLTQIGQFLGLQYVNVEYDTVMTTQMNQFVPDLTPFDVFYIKCAYGIDN